MSEETAHVCVGAAFRLLSHQEGEVCPGLLDIRVGVLLGCGGRSRSDSRSVSVWGKAS